MSTEKIRMMFTQLSWDQLQILVPELRRPVALFDMECRYQCFSPAYAARNGLDESALQQPLEQAHQSSHVKLLRQGFHRLLRECDSLDITLPPTGAAITGFSGQLFKVCDQQGVIRGMLLVGADDIPAAAEPSVSLAPEGISVALSFQDEQGNFQWGNDTFMGYQWGGGGLSVGQSMQSVYPQSCADELGQMDQQVLASQRNDSRCFSFKLGDQEHSFQVVKQPFVVGSGRSGVLTAFLPVDSGVSERQPEGGSGENVSSSAYSEACSACVLIDENGVIEACNSGAAVLLGVNEQMLNGQPVDQLFKQLSGTEPLSELLRERSQWQGKVLFSQGSWLSDTRTCRAHMVSRSTRGGGVLILVAEESFCLDEDALLHSWLACHDVVTGLPNSSATLTRLEHSINQSDRSLTFVGVLYLDLDNFRDINERLGRGIGDRVLSALAAALQSTLRKGDTLGRIESDTFLVALEQINGLERIGQDYLGAPLTASIGVALAPEDGTEAIELIHKAHLAMCEAKRRGRDQVCYFSTLRYPLLTTMFNHQTEN